MPELNGTLVMVAIAFFFVGVVGFLLVNNWWDSRKKATCECGDPNCEGHDAE
ncbi:hypothetical protein LCGC14_2822340 [marine sediment metagenome]|uniref:Post-SET domain-containing protein n=1 Tax=marine sediment metagenome TaxID=412755 RepID=A0A0F8Z3C5_9ZZZZ